MNCEINNTAAMNRVSVVQMINKNRKDTILPDLSFKLDLNWENATRLGGWSYMVILGRIDLYYLDNQVKRRQKISSEFISTVSFRH